MVDDPKRLLRDFKEEFHIMPAGYSDQKEEEKEGEAKSLGKKKPAGKSLFIPVLIILFLLLLFRK